jgi:ribosomal protein L32
MCAKLTKQEFRKRVSDIRRYIKRKTYTCKNKDKLESIQKYLEGLDYIQNEDGVDLLLDDYEYDFHNKFIQAKRDRLENCEICGDNLDSHTLCKYCGVLLHDFNCSDNVCSINTDNKFDDTRCTDCAERRNLTK